jgi:hypothetical protein
MSLNKLYIVFLYMAKTNKSLYYKAFINLGVDLKYNMDIYKVLYKKSYSIFWKQEYKNLIIETVHRSISINYVLCKYLPIHLQFEIFKYL